MTTTTKATMTTESTPAATEDDGLVLSIARVAHEVCGALAVANGDYTSKPWEALTNPEQKVLRARVACFLNNPGMHPTADLGSAVATLTAHDRAKAYVFHGVVHAIAREQSRT